MLTEKSLNNIVPNLNLTARNDSVQKRNKIEALTGLLDG
jgi:hypothetical protein